MLDDVRAARAAARDRRLAESLLARLQPRISRIVVKLAGSGAESRDHLQVCMLEVLRALPSFRGGSSLETWAGAVAFRVLMRQLKRQRRRERTVLVDNEASMREEKTPARVVDQARMRTRV